MIKVICGLSGSGKTTYALNNKKNNDILLDLDSLKEALQNYTNYSLLKNLQLELLKYFHNLDFNIWYITCFPNIEELNFFDSNNADFIWINTNKNKCTENIIKRNRKNDIKDIDSIISYNQYVQDKYISSNIKFHVIEVFKSNEKW